MTVLSGDPTAAARAQPAVLFLDFDNTVTTSDVLDLIIARYSRTNRWRQWEAEWRDGRISTLECLRSQISDLRVTPEELIEFTDRIQIDDGFMPLVSWAMAHKVETSIVSDNFTLIIKAMLQRRGLPEMRIYANHLTFHDDRPRASFPLVDPGCARCAHCKAQHIRRVTGRRRLFVGDGLSDICPAAAADVVFAKDSLANYLRSIGSPYRPFRSLADVLGFLQATYGHVSGPVSSARSGRH
jgi:2-hydroxy-3-keto-5-methylthiopentenyl-1-phosphate phosphatase